MFDISSRAAFAAAMTFVAATCGAQTTIFTFSGATPGETYGASVRGVTDLNLDGFPDLVVGAPGAPPNGRVSVISGFDGAVLYEVLGTVTSGFGVSVSDAGDVNADGAPDLILGGMNGSTGYAQVVSGLTGTVIYTFQTGGSFDGFGISVSGAGDVDNDGYDDVIVGGFSSATVFSGLTGQTLFTVTLGGFTIQGLAVAAAGDVDNDGFDDVLVGDESAATGPGVFSGGVVRLYAGPSGATLRTVGGATFEFLGHSVAGLGDVNGDGVRDFIAGGPQAASSTGLARIYSGQTGGVIRTSSSPLASLQFGSAVANARDANGDGVDDVIVSGIGGGPNANFPGVVVVQSGLTGATLATVTGNPFDRLGYGVSSAGDLTADGAPEIILGAPSSGFGGPPGYARVVSLGSIPAAAATPVGSGCGAGAIPPVLTVSPAPILGQTATLAVTLATAQRNGLVFAALPPATAQPIGGGCVVYLPLGTIASWLSIPITTDASGSSALSIPLAGVPTLAGTQVALQAVVLPTSGPLGFDLTNAVVVTLGF